MDALIGIEAEHLLRFAFGKRVPSDEFLIQMMQKFKLRSD